MAKIISSKHTKEQKEQFAKTAKLTKERYKRVKRFHEAIKKESETPGYYAGARGTKGSPGAIAQLLQGRPKLAKKGWK